MPGLFDVVTVPDFSGRYKAVFEARALLFLAAYKELGLNADELPLSLVCIGEPPSSVKWLAERCGAKLHSALPNSSGPPGMANKVRGLEVEGDNRQRLLLDVDVIIFSDPRALATIAPGLAAAPAVLPRVPERYWRRIYECLGRKMPEARIPSAVGALRRAPLRVPRYPEQNAETAAMVPYYNGGILFFPQGCGLETLWPELVLEISRMFAEADPIWDSLGKSDQAGLAVALQLLQDQGLPFQQLSGEYHGFWMHLYRQSAPLAQMKLFHTFDLFRGLRSIQNMGAFLRRYRLSLMRTMVTEWAREQLYRPSVSAAGRYLVPGLMDSYRLGSQLIRLYETQVQPALAQAATVSQ